MSTSVKEIIRRRKSVRTFSGSFAVDDPGFATDDSIEYIVTYEVRH